MKEDETMESSNRPDDSRDKIDKILKKVREDLENSTDPIPLLHLNSFERKLVHRAFDHNPDIVTKTYRDGEEFELRVYPIGNLKRFAESKAGEATETGGAIKLPHMSSYERFVIHDFMKGRDDIKSSSQGEGEERHIILEPNSFGRGLKKIIRKIRLF
jgi:predicted RNA-binding protein Jag